MADVTPLTSGHMSIGAFAAAFKRAGLEGVTPAHPEAHSRLGANAVWQGHAMGGGRLFCYEREGAA